jgi:hypothetical protein
MFSIFPNRPFSELSEKEQAQVLSEMSRETYDLQFQMYLLSQKSKARESDLFPRKELKGELLKSMRPTPFLQVSWVIKTAAAAAIVGFIVFNFNTKTPNNQIIISENKTQSNIENKIEQSVVITKTIVSAKKKNSKKHKKINAFEATASDIALTFTRNNPNLVWQEEEEEINEASTLPELKPCINE